MLSMKKLKPSKTCFRKMKLIQKITKYMRKDILIYILINYDG